MTAPERREQILDATRHIVDQRGFHAVSIEAVARAAGITRPIVYEHFESLGGLLEALIRREGARALGQLSAALSLNDTRGSAREQLLGALRSYLLSVRGDPTTWRLVLMPPEGAPAALREQIAVGRNRIVGQLAELVRPGFGPGSESPDPELHARLLSAIADESARLLLTDPQRFPVERLLAHAEWVLQRMEIGAAAGRSVVG